MTNSTEKVIAKNIKYYRNKSNLTQLKLSINCGISEDYISEIERGKKLPSLKRLIILANALGIEPYLLLKP